MKKYGLFCGDFHCGHLIGLTPQKFQVKSYDASSTKRNKWRKIQEELWLNFEDILKRMPPLDFAVINGDMIEGKNERAGGTEVITTSMEEQSDMAVYVIWKIQEHLKPKGKIIATYGTPYHTAVGGDDWENIIANKSGISKIGSHEWINVNGLCFDIKHHVGSSGVPHGRHTAIAREMVWNALWNEETLQPKADIVVRSHVHYYTHCGNSSRLAMTLPALQGMGSKFGSRICSGLVDWGMVLFEIENKNGYNWYPFLRRIQTQRARAMKI